MVAVPQRTRLEAGDLTFLDETGATISGHAARRFAVALPGDVEDSIDAVDRALATAAWQEGHSVQQIASVRLTLVFETVEAPRVEKALPVEVYRDAGGETFTSAAPVVGAWGHGATIGESVLDFLTDYQERSSILMAHRGSLGPTLERQAGAFERWRASAE